MRNLKRALSLALATVMTLGLMVVGTGAVGYQDVDRSDNQEAIEVLQAVGIMTGVTDDEFDPDGLVTRNQIAVIMANLLNLDYDYYRGSNPFTDVPTWAAPYVAACAAEGVVAGIGGGLYGGENNVTAAQAALMLMKALGYFQYQDDFGSDWQVATIRQASQIGLFSGVDSNAEAALTRSQVAQLVLNGLKTDMVEFTGTVGTQLTLPDGTTYTSGYVAEYSSRTSSDTKYNTLVGGKTDIAEQGQYYIQLGEELYDGDLTEESDTDTFGRPATTWELDGEKIGTYADEADNSLVLNKSIGYDDLMTDDSDYFNLKSSDISSDVVVYINGDEEADAEAASFQAGDVVELFENDDKEIETVAVTRYTLAKIDGVDDELSSTLEKRGATYAIDLTDLSNGDFANANVDGSTYYDDYNDSDRVLNGFIASTYVEGTILAVAADKGGVILAAYVAEAVAGTISRYNSGSEASFTVDGTAYPLTAQTKGEVSSLSYNDAEYTLYLTSDGYVIGFETGGSVSIDDVYYVTGVVADGSGRYDDIEYYAQVVALDGTIDEIELEAASAVSLAEGNAAVIAGETTGNEEKIFVEDASGTYYLCDDGSEYDGQFSTDTTHVSDENQEVKYAAYDNMDDAVSTVFTDENKLIEDGAGLYTFTDSDGSYAESKSGNDKYTAEVYNHAADSAYYAATAGNLTEDLKRDASSIILDNPAGDSLGSRNRAYVDENTQYIKIEEPGNDIDVSTATGGTSVTTATTDAVAVIASKSGSNYTAAYVVLVSADGFASAAADADIIYVDSESTENVARNEWALTAYFLDGSGEQEITANMASEDNHFYTYTINEDGVYQLTDITDDDDYYAYTADGEDYEDGTGLVTDAKLTGVYNDQLSGSKSSDDFTFDDVDFSADVVIIDSRSAADKNDDYVTGDITTISALRRAIDREEITSVVADVYLDDGEVILVAVKSLSPDVDGSDGGEDGDGTEIAFEGVKTINNTSSATADDLQSRATGVYVLKTTPEFLAEDISGDIAENLFFIFHSDNEDEVISLQITKEDDDSWEWYESKTPNGTSVYYFFYIWATHDGEGNDFPAGSDIYGDYTWTITGVKSGELASGTFSIVDGE